ncbi:hypothetical protein DH2020_003867 [Rehmannia glutinosa]|uniref:peptidylprolyl isomerase n=1 Tax=Rehmannia glutinosa TaxID=99300 RepID=A0ABR0XN80_REHGL
MSFLASFAFLLIPSYAPGAFPCFPLSVERHLFFLMAIPVWVPRPRIIVWLLPPLLWTMYLCFLLTYFTDFPGLKRQDQLKTKQSYSDSIEKLSGKLYKNLGLGSGSTPKIGEIVVVDWDGYTIGYYGRIFEARNKTKGGSFVGDDKDFYKFRLGSQEVIPAFEEAVSGMALGGIRRIIVPPELGYPENDYNKKGPRPTTFSGQRALDFVLRNQGLIDKTLLFDIELLKIVPNGRG